MSSTSWSLKSVHYPLSDLKRGHVIDSEAFDSLRVT